MYENFSPRAQRLLIALAQDEAYYVGSRYIEVEHIILAMLKSADGLGYVSLQHMRINVLTLQLALEQSLPSSNRDRGFKTIPNSDRTNNFLGQAASIAKNMGNNYVGTEHLLFASIIEEKSLVWAYFRKANITIQSAKDSIVEIQKKIPSSASIKAQDKPMSNFIPPKKEMSMSDGSSQRSQKTGGILEQFSRDLTQRAREEKLEPFVGREKEVDRLVQILCRKTKNNPVLVGEPGVGKTAIVEGLAQLVSAGKVPGDLLDKRVVQLDLAAMIAGTKYRGEFEERLKKVMKEIADSKNVILFVDELHTIIGAGGPEGSMDASNMIKPALSRGELQIIGATTTKEYRKYFEKDAALVRRFQMIKVEEPDLEQCCRILEGLKHSYEEFHKVYYDDDVIPLVVKLTDRYINERCLPDKAIDILDEAGAVKKIREGVKPAELEKLEESFSSLAEEKRLLVQNQEYEQAAFVRDKMNAVRINIDELNRMWKKTSPSQRSHVTSDDVCALISSMTGIDVSSLDDSKTERLLNMEKYIHKDVVGQDEAVSLISSACRRSRAGVSSHKRPLGSFIFLGPTGVGKTQLAKALAKFLFGSEDALIRVDMSDYMEKHTASRLVGAPPGYVGYEEGGMLTEAVRQHPYSVVLLDEIEKAHHDVFNLLLQMLEEGEIRDSLDHKVSFKNTIVIMTSNAGAREITADSRLGFSTVKEGVLPYSEIKASAMQELKRIMAPELINRIDDVIVFDALSREQVSAILDIQLEELKSRLEEKNIELTLKPKAREYLVEHGYDPSMGARPMRRLVQKEIEDKLANLLLESGSYGWSDEKKNVVIDCAGEVLSVKFKKQGKSSRSQLTDRKKVSNII